MLTRFERWTTEMKPTEITSIEAKYATRKRFSYLSYILSSFKLILTHQLLTGPYL